MKFLVFAHYYDGYTDAKMATEHEIKKITNLSIEQFKERCEKIVMEVAEWGDYDDSYTSENLLDTIEDARETYCDIEIYFGETISNVSSIAELESIIGEIIEVFGTNFITISDSFHIIEKQL